MNKRGYNKSNGVVVFRADASLQIGSGHVMRCLTLATALREKGKECHFLCREHPGHLIGMIEKRGFRVHWLAMPEQSDCVAGDAKLSHEQWLGTSWQADAEACRLLLAHLSPDWLIVDHYALDIRWEKAVLSRSTRLMVIDDLADRPHQADLLLDQNLGRDVTDYANWVPASCRVLAGANFALLRPEFATLRKISLARRHQHPQLKRLLVNLGGVDKDNVTGQVLNVLRDCALPSTLHIEVVMGVTAPWLDDVRLSASNMPWPTQVVVNVNNMAERMASADFAIGAAGSTSWERCCLGLPTLMVVLADNQWPIAQALANQNGAICLGTAERLHELPSKLVAAISQGMLYRMSLAAESVTDGEGVKRLIECMEEKAIDL